MTRPLFLHGTAVASAPRTTAARANGCDVTVLEWSGTNTDAGLLTAWSDLLRTQATPTLLFSSTRWLDHLVASGDPEVAAIVVKSEEGKISGAIPIRRERYALGYEPRSGLSLSKLIVADVLGSFPLLEMDDVGAARAIAGALDALPDCDAMLFDAIPVQSRYHRVLESLGCSDRFMSYFVEPERPAHRLELGPGLDEYLGLMKPKGRNNLRRAVTKLRDLGGFEFVRVRLPDEVDGFLREATAVRRASWQHESAPELGGNARANARHLHDLARRGLLRSYVLRSRGSACAFVIGFQGDGVYYYWEVGYGCDYAKYSPGTVLLYLLIEDLFAFDPPVALDFGRGDAAFKRRFGTSEYRVATCLLFRRTLRNRVRIRAHRSLRVLFKTWEPSRDIKLDIGSTSLSAPRSSPP